MLMSDFKNKISTGKPALSFTYPLDIHGENIFDPPKTALILGYPIISLHIYGENIFRNC
jgi:hypothetical protein